MKILGIIAVMLTLSGQQTTTSERYDANNTSGIVSVQPANRLTVNTAEAAFIESQASNSGGGANAQLAISIWNDLNEMCRGGSGDRPETLYACCVRTKVSSVLNNLGYCYRMGDVWRKCRPVEKSKVRAAALTNCVR